MTYLKIRNRFSPLVLLTFVLLFSCTKETGPTGPAGPQGPQGEQGNANVQTYTFPISSVNWGIFGSNWQVNLSIPALSQAIIDNGSVTIYWEQSNLSTAMPFAIGPVDFMYYMSVNQINIQVSEAGNYAFSNPSFYTPVNFKVVVVPGP